MQKICTNNEPMFPDVNQNNQMTSKPSLEERSALEARWLELTKQTLPALAVKREWPIRNDHCFQRVMLDAACGGCWYDHISHRPAYRCASDVILQSAVSLAESVASEVIDLNTLNLQSLRWRGKCHA
jgi:hypothetical protein